MIPGEIRVYPLSSYIEDIKILAQISLRGTRVSQ